MGGRGRTEHAAGATEPVLSGELAGEAAELPPSHGAPKARVFLLDEPVQLVRPDPLHHRNLVIVRENVQHLHHMHGAVAVVAVVGKFHSGKSFLMNQLMGKQSGFGIGPSVQPKTMGVWMWGKVHHPQTHPQTHPHRHRHMHVPTHHPTSSPHMQTHSHASTLHPVLPRSRWN